MTIIWSNFLCSIDDRLDSDLSSSTELDLLILVNINAHSRLSDARIWYSARSLAAIEQLDYKVDCSLRDWN